MVATLLFSRSSHTWRSTSPLAAEAAMNPSHYRFTKEHPLHETHAMRFVSDNLLHIPNFVGANLPRCDQGDREYYCCSMLTIFKPWRSGLDLKRSQTVSWDEEFASHVFSDPELAVMKNFNMRYECLDA